MTSWLPYLLGAVGLTVVITMSHIARPLRYWGCRALRRCGLTLPCPLYCSMCTGVWVGAAIGAYHLLSAHGPEVVLAAPARFMLDVAALAFGTSVVSFVVTTWLASQDVYTTPEQDKEPRKSTPA